ncbi:hypothetical protein QQZ08_007601 [Neonectria magnoliae]|uniref:SET domain-containing protein n=1 Tax=Neonectria magnoliae TaxID=2732573 RepID=A0ABR1HY83_9HYPO
MGIDAGFDMVPRLTKEAVDQDVWQRFIRSVKEHYEDDDRVEIKPNYLLFKVGEHPMLPFEGHKFLRFSSKISGRIATESNAMDYIRTVYLMAEVNFGPRVRKWSESSDQYGHYGWAEPDEPKATTSIASFGLNIDPSKGPDIPLFEVKPISGKGRGLVARVNIPKGTRILLEKPILTSQSMPLDMTEKILASKLKSLSIVEQRQFLSLHNNFPGKLPFRGIMKTNALPCGSDSTVGAVYPTICFINHSCLPNSHNNWNDDKGHETIHATRPIMAGQEITLPYDKGGPSSARQAKLQQSFGFLCDCTICSLPGPELLASDARRLKMQRLDDAIGDPLSMMTSPGASLANCYSLLQTLEEEFRGSPGVLLARVQYDAFQISIAHGDQARAAVFAENAYRSRVECEGEDSPAAQKMKALMQNPASHASFGACSMYWKMTRKSAPKGLDADEFRKWLWRQNK